MSELGRRGDVPVVEAVAEFLRLARAKRPYLVIAVILYSAVHAADALQATIVKQHRHPVAGDLHVHLDEARTGGHGGLDADQGVLRIMPGITPVSHQLRDDHRATLAP